MNVTPVKINARPMMTLTAKQLSLVEQNLIDVRQAIIRVTDIDRQDIQDIRQMLHAKGCYFIASIQVAGRASTISLKPDATNFNMTRAVKEFAKKQNFQDDIVKAERILMDFINAAPEVYE